MPSVGFSILFLQQPNATAESPELCEKWRFNKKLYDQFFGHSYPLQVYRGLDYPSCVITFGPFSDPAEHLEDFAQSEQMDEYLEEFGGVVDLHCAFHMEKIWEEVPIQCEYLTLLRYVIDEGRIKEFEQAFDKFIPNFMSRPSKISHVSGWLTQGGWTRTSPGDDAEKLAGVKRAPEELEALENIDEDSNDSEWVCCLGWSSEDALKEAFAEMETPYKDRDASWKGLDTVVKASKQVSIWNFKKVHFE